MITTAILLFIEIGIAQQYSFYTELEFRHRGEVLIETFTDNDERVPRTTLHGDKNHDIRYRDSFAQNYVAGEELPIGISRRFHLIDFIGWLY
jgi:hypothetical protein